MTRETEYSKENVKLKSGKLLSEVQYEITYEEYSYSYNHDCPIGDDSADEYECDVTDFRITRVIEYLEDEDTEREIELTKEEEKEITQELVDYATYIDSRS